VAILAVFFRWSMLICPSRTCQSLAASTSAVKDALDTGGGTASEVSSAVSGLSSSKIKAESGVRSGSRPGAESSAGMLL